MPKEYRNEASINHAETATNNSYSTAGMYHAKLNNETGFKPGFRTKKSHHLKFQEFSPIGKFLGKFARCPLQLREFFNVNRLIVSISVCDAVNGAFVPIPIGIKMQFGSGFLHVDVVY